MNIQQALLTPGNAHGRTGKTLKPEGVVIHYVGNPGSSAMANRNYFENGSGGNHVSAHYIVGLQGEIVLCVPENERAAHAGKSFGKQWDAMAKTNNSRFIGIEVCHPDATGKFSPVTYAALVELAADICKRHGFDPRKQVLRHYDVTGKDCPLYYVKNEVAWAKFISDVAIALSPVIVNPTSEPDPAAIIWPFFLSKGLPPEAIAGLMGNLYAESGLIPNNLQNSFQPKLGMDDAAYTAAVDNGTYSDFAIDSAGYGLAQWTYHTRKRRLLDFAKEAGASIGDLAMQLNFLWQELQGYTELLSILKTAKTVREASDAVLFMYEQPADQGEAVKARRAGYGQGYYDRFAGETEAAPIVEQAPPDQPSEWAKEAWDWAMQKKITDGTNPQGLATREQVIQMIRNYYRDYAGR
jgi:hypothetical protein